MKKGRILRATLCTIGFACLFPAGCHKEKQAQQDHPRLVPGVSMQDVTFYSTALKRAMIYRVFLPSTIAPGQKLPVVYLLHGGDGGGFRDWSNYSDVAQYAGLARSGGLILVMPEGAFSYYQNAILKPEDRYEDYITNDLISEVENRFPAAKGRENRAMIGISMGGFAAINLALTRPQLFFFVGAFSPSIEVVHRRFSIMRIRQWWRLRTIFGRMGNPARQSRDPFALVESADPAVTPYIFLTAGEREPLLEPNRRFASRLNSRHFAFEFHTKPGGHDWGDWDAQIPGCFDSLLQHLKREP
jgi:S-formylglutathione hydrolase FrmB